MKSKTVFRASLLLVFILTFCLLTVLPIAAGTLTERLYDQADLLSSSERSELRQRLNEVSEKYKINVIIVTTADLDGKTPEAYADDFYDSHFGINTDGILLLRYKNSFDRYVHISTSGSCISAFTDVDIEIILDNMQPFCNIDDDAGSFNAFIDSVQNEYSYKKIWIVIGLMTGLIIAGIVTGNMKNQLKTVKPQRYAGNYIRDNSVNITESRDTFLYKNVSRVRIERSSSSSGGSSTHTSSSGGSHGGGGRHM